MPNRHGKDVVQDRVAEGGAIWWTERAVAGEWERQHEAEWLRVDQQLRGIAGRRAALDAEEAQLLRYAEEVKLWRAFGFGSLLEYMERAMGYAPHTAAERLRVARVLAELPLLGEALQQGELAHSAVRELSRVAIPDTEGAWLEAARGKSLREIEAMVSGHKPGHLPTDPTEPRLHRKTITIDVSPETYDLWRKMHALAAEEHGQRVSDDELISSVFHRAYGEGGGGGVGGTPAYKIALKQCPDCKRAWQYSGGRDIEVDPAVVECAACDATRLGSLDVAIPERTTTTVTARKREQVLARDGHCCTVPGCRRNVGIDLHHIEYQSRGGGHDLWNITSCCTLHHKAIHEGKLVIRGTAPDRLTFEFRKPRDRRNITDDDAAEPRSAERAQKDLVGEVGPTPDLGRRRDEARAPGLLTSRVAAPGSSAAAPASSVAAPASTVDMPGSSAAAPASTVGMPGSSAATQGSSMAAPVSSFAASIPVSGPSHRRTPGIRSSGPTWKLDALAAHRDESPRSRASGSPEPHGLTR